MTLLALWGAAPVAAAEDPGVQGAGFAVRGQVRPQRQLPQRQARAVRQRQPVAPAAPVAVAPVEEEQRYEGVTVASAELQEMRGGFFDSSGFLVRFGFDISTHVNGILTQRLTLADTNITPSMSSLTVNETQSDGTVTPRPITQTSLASGPATFVNTANGGATTISTSLASGGIISAIQNSANNQLIQRTAVINLEVIGLRNILNNHSAARFTSQALATRTIFGR
jgi:hypothetical protein